jgi:hypothetical protein
MYHAEQEKRDAKGNSLYESLYMKFENTHLWSLMVVTVGWVRRGFVGFDLGSGYISRLTWWKFIISDLCAFLYICYILRRDFLKKPFPSH